MVCRGKPQVNSKVNCNKKSVLYRAECQDCMDKMQENAEMVGDRDAKGTTSDQRDRDQPMVF